ncbi:MAG: hypothetical protein CMP76_06010 [Flavobacterium sp.]|uniref:hypothetical protein n=1 Tax=Flavobacterium sp. TaxID=239 RepID=UPI000C4CEE14|nr:hypothetical protein [Flavobacterium sp.]MBF02834.1 hypothetical protein [Flavobacterium sp.]|tara:strand:- start:1001 stop:1678 length:678 start_codon:yes stop_codon:yes gene_type:complete
MKNILLVLLLYVTISCQIEYDGETKLVIKGTVLNENNTPLTNHEINVFVSKNSSFVPYIYYSPSEINNIGKAFTDTFGNFTIVIPKPERNFTEIIVEINDDSNSFNSTRIINIQNDNFNHYEMQLGVYKLFNKSNLCELIIIPNNINSENELLEISYQGEIADELVFYNLPEEYNFYYDNIKKVVKNQTILLNYTIKNHIENTLTNFQEEIQIDSSSQINYTLNY